MAKLFPKVALLIISVFILCVSTAKGQSRAITHFDAEDGLPGNITYGVMQDKAGYIWIPTNNGICRYDGREFKLYDSPLIKNNEILKCKEAMGMVWFYSYNGDFFYIENDLIKQYPIEKNLFVEDWIEVDPSTMLVKTRAKGVRFPVKRIKKEKNGLEEKLFPLVGRGPLEMLGKYQDEVYLFYHETIYRYDRQQDTIVPHLQNNMNTRVMGVLDGKLFIYDVTNFRYYEFVGNGMEEIDFLSSMFKERRKLVSGIKDRQGRYWFTNKQKLILADNTRGANSKDVSSLINNNGCNEIFIDREGNIWFSTNADGVYVLKNNPFLQYNTSNSELPQNYIYDIDGDHKGNVYIATILGDLTVMNGSEIQTTSKIKNSRSEVYDVLVDDDQVYVILEDIHLFKFDSEKKLLERKNTLDLSTPKRLSKSNGNSMFIANGYYLFHWKEKEKIAYQTWISINTKVYNSAELPDNNVLMGTTNGLFYLDKQLEDDAPITFDDRLFLTDSLTKEFSTIRYVEKMEERWGPVLQKTYMLSRAPIVKKCLFQNDESIDYYVADIQVSSDSSAWVATTKNGVYHLVRDSIIHHYTASETGLTSNICNRIFIDKDQTVWVATMGGVSLIDPKTKRVQKITKGDGLNSNHVNSIYCNDSMVYVGTAKGLTLFNKDEIQTATPFPILINQVKINESDTTFHSEYVLSYNENSLYFRFIGLTFKGEIKYKYRLKGLVDDWVYTYDDHVRFSEIAPGNYTFEVKSITKEGLESEQPAAVKIEIKPHPLLSRLAYLVYFLLLITGFLLFYRWRINNIKKEEKEKTEVNKKIAELELQALQAQMNPHFVFNSLGAIQHFILQNDKETASRYLSDFGQLMRLFLESSKEKYILLEEELELITLYIKLEKMRFEGSFNSTIEVAEEINTGDLEIPSFLLQPFVENAINHGLRYKKEKGNLYISFITSDDGEFLKCTITDDGVGRKKSAEIKKSAFKGYKSRGSKIVEDRLNVLSFLEENEITATIIDLEENGVAKGTTVEINIPLRYEH